MSQQYDDTDTFILFVNDKGDNPKRPDRKGKLNVGGTNYKISGWIVTDENGKPKKDKNGNPMLRGKVKLDEVLPASQTARPGQTAAQADCAAFVDDIPF